MSDLGFNKIAGAVLATGLVILGLKELSSAVYAPEPAAKPGYAIAVQEAAAEGGAAQADVPPDWGTVLPAANVAAGEEQSKKCVSCHTFTNGGANGTGPNNFGVVGRKPGAHPGFAYSTAMTDFGAKQPVWDYEQIAEFIKEPQKHMPGTKMTFVGLKKTQDRVNVIAYLHGQGSTLPIPAPNPAAAAAPATATDAAAPAAAASGATPAEGAGGAHSQGPAATAQAPASQAATPQPAKATH